ncbi:MAG TPA: hypothetical protein VFQ61_08830, partial [Polyangiaceae bacterium]|nr:hypothetical protein [Polyangiaceae bacterium]
VPIVPIVIDGTGSILAKGTVGIRPQAVIVRVLEPIHAAPGERDGRSLQRRVFERMQRELDLIRRAEPGHAEAMHADAKHADSTSLPALPTARAGKATPAGTEDAATQDAFEPS